MENVKINKKVIFIFGISILLIASLFFSVSAYYKYKTFTNGGQWYCIANECIDYAVGDELINNICKIESGNMVCKFNLNGKDYKVGMNELDVKSLENIKDVKIFRDGCSQWKCSTQLFLKGDGNYE